jgi:hypothetical protein
MGMKRDRYMSFLLISLLDLRRFATYENQPDYYKGYLSVRHHYN